MASYMPQHPGLLPYFLLYAAATAAIHTAFCYTRPVQSLLQFSGPGAPPAHPLLARVYGVKNIYTALIRGFAAYNLANQPVYDLATCTFLGVFALYSTEWLVFRTVGRREVVVPLVTSTVGVVWMLAQRGFYVG